MLFVVDDLQQPLGILVRRALNRADELGMRSLTLPMMRTGVMAGVFESPEQAVRELSGAITSFVDAGPRFVETITVVVYEQDSIVRALKGALAVES